mgnify:CR=1 FL=1
MRIPLKWPFALAFAAVVALAFAARFMDLGHSAVRSDELNMLHYAQGGATLQGLWTDPPWLNQIPLADSIPVLWAKAQPGRTADEKMIREPFALLGLLTVAFCMAWTLRRRGIGAGVLAGVWMAVVPFHVYHSREAYYYTLLMWFASGMALRGADFMVRLKATGSLKAREYAEWTAWALMACLSHMAAWVVAGMTGLLLATSGWSALKAAERKRHAWAMGIVAVSLGAGMSRWLWRAVLEMQRTAATSTGHIGSAFDWIAPRVLPFFSGGANAAGIGILAAAGAAAAWLLWRSRGRPGREDPLYGAVLRIAACGLLATYAYIFFVGGGEKAKLVYFSANFPVFLVWAAMTLDKAFARAGGKRQPWLDAGAAALIAGLLAFPSWQVTRLDGKPTAYRPIRAWLDANLPKGDVVLIDRWLEPWNEMATYAPSNVTVTFTVPDDPYENYVRFNWRQATKAQIERNGAQAFIRIARNQEKLMGPWTWPETWFHHRAVVTNEAGLWLRDTGFAPMEEFYSETNRVLTEIFYDTHEEIAERERAAGRDSVHFFGEGWKLFKPWQQGDFTDYRVLEGEGVLSIHNLRGEPLRAKAVVVAAAMGGNQVVKIGDQPPLTFAAQQFESRSFELELPQGVHSLRWQNLGRGGALLVREFRLERIPQDPAGAGAPLHF